MKEQRIKPVLECQSIGEVLVTLQHMAKELNQIPGVRANMTIANPVIGKRKGRLNKLFSHIFWCRFVSGGAIGILLLLLVQKLLNR